jgi:hypothetical protein
LIILLGPQQANLHTGIQKEELLPVLWPY